MANVRVVPPPRPGDVCMDCGRTRADVALRWVTLLTATDCWLCSDSWSCARHLQLARPEA